MPEPFAELVEEVRQRSIEEKVELLTLLQRDLVEARRDELASHAAAAKEEYESGKLKFTANVGELQRAFKRD